MTMKKKKRKAENRGYEKIMQACLRGLKQSWVRTFSL